MISKPTPRPWQLLGPRWVAVALSLVYGLLLFPRHQPLHFFSDLGGYYNYLTRGFAEGQLHVPIQPSKEILSAPNPQDPSLPAEWKMHDMALYKGHYYLYHGIGPVLLLFGPWRMLSGYDLPEAVAVWLFLSLGVWALLLLARPLNAWKILALGFCSGVLLLLSRVWVYEVAISCGFACLAWAFLFREEGEDLWAGICLGLALLSRPHLALAAFFFRSRSFVGFAIAACLMAAYNYARFDSPLELGLRYLLSGPNQQIPSPSWEKFFASLYLLLFQAPEFRLLWPGLFPRLDAFFTIPPALYHEPLIGAFFFAPFVFLSRGKARSYLLTGLVTLSFVAATAWVTQRYLLDFLPWLVLASLPAAQPALLLRCLIFAGALVSLLDILRL